MKVVVGLAGQNTIPSSDVDGWLVDDTVIPHDWVVHEQRRQEEERERKLKAFLFAKEVERKQRIRDIAEGYRKNGGIPDDVPLDLLFP
jgi:hypothetical protein